ncbi:MAG: hypothetical protein BWY22_02456 [Bacteroidetes bacterium ADurb.Bin217]|nr:MAG: hypothetical protein BWY22_02456 [Bacteroidetes bacterium ADurb.Bin217]
MGELLIKAFAILIATMILVRVISRYLLPWFVKRFFPDKYESFRKEYLEPNE